MRRHTAFVFVGKLSDLCALLSNAAADEKMGALSFVPPVECMDPQPPCIPQNTTRQPLYSVPTELLQELVTKHAPHGNHALVEINGTFYYMHELTAELSWR